MRLVSLICKILLGGLFIFSGLIKLNDPYGTAYKLEEYFQVFASDFSPFFLHFKPISLFLSVFISGLEVILGVALLINYRMKITLWVSMALMVFFTFLTFYSFAFDKVSDCGCFGTAIKLTPFQSFIKDLILLALLAVLFFRRGKLNVYVSPLKYDIIIGVSALIAFGLGVYSKNHLPYLDPTPYKTGNNLKKLTMPHTAEYVWIMEKNGKEYRFDNKHYPSDTSYKYKGRELLTDSSLLIPVISGYKIFNGEEDITEESLKGTKFFIIIAKPLEAMESCDKGCATAINELVKKIEGIGVQALILTSQSEEAAIEEYRHEVQLSGDYYFMDDTVVKTMIRSNPGFILLSKGIIKGKWHYSDIPDIETIRSLIK